jgi:hypothetical protein
MRDVLLITGPMNATQLGVPDDADYDVVQVHPPGSDLRSSMYHQAMLIWLQGLPLRTRLEKKLGGPVGKIGVAWFSAGHGAVKALLKGETVATDVSAWLCLDGLYGSNAFAVTICEWAIENQTSILATASTSTPGQYDHSLDRWRDAVAKAKVPAISVDAAARWDLPQPDELWGAGSCMVAGYEHLGHHEQVPAVREAMLKWWNVARATEPSPGGEVDPKPPVSDQEEDEGTSPWLIVGIAVLGGLLGWGFDRIVNPKGHKK